MDRVMIFLAASLVAACAVFTGWNTYQLEQAKQAEPQVAVTQVAQVEPVADRVVQLPEDGGAFHTSLFLHDNWKEIPVERELVAWWSTEPRLASLKVQTHHHLYTPRSPLYRVRWSRAIGDQLPAVLVQDVTGKIYYKVSGESVPKVAAEMGDQVERIFHRLRPCPCPRPNPTPDVTPDPEPDEGGIPIVVPDVTPPEPEPEPLEDFPWLVLVGVCLAAGVGSLVYQIKSEVRGAL